MDEQVTLVSITQKQLESFKCLHPGDPRIQALPLNEVVKNLDRREVDWHSVLLDQLATPVAAGIELTECQKAIGIVVFDVFCLALGAVALRGTVNSATINAVAQAVVPVQSKLEVIIARLSGPNVSPRDQALAVFDILRAIYKGECLGAIAAAFSKSLTWWNALLYGITSVATIVALVATDGVAFVTEIVLLLATFGFLVSDSIRAANACRSQIAAPEPSPATISLPEGSGNPYPFEPVIAIKTVSGNFLTVADNGGLGQGSDVGIRTYAQSVGPMEKFSIQLVSEQDNTFALLTAAQTYVTAVRGGGINGPNNNEFPIHTSATVIGPWEKLTLVQQGDGTYAICTSSGYYLSARGGYGGEDNPINTNRTERGPWETFTVVRVL